MPISSVLGSSALLPAGLGFRNILINGAMQIAQRGTSATGITVSSFPTCDRWELNLSSGGTWASTQSTDAPSGFSNSLRVQCTTANASLATTNNARIWQKIEGFNVQQLAKGTIDSKPVALTFWVKSFQTGTFICTIDDLVNNRKISASYTINASATWEKKTLYFVGDTTGTIPSNSNASLMMTWWLAAGPSFQGSSLSTAWSSGATLSDYANGQTNVASSTSNYFQITGVQLEQNVQPTPFEQRPYGVELQLCQRYFETSNGVCQVVGGATGFGGNTYFSWVGYKVEKRIALSVVTNNISQGVRVFATDGGADYITYWKAATQYYSNAENFEVTTTQGFALVTSAGGQVDAGLGRFYWNANAEL